MAEPNQKILNGQLYNACFYGWHNKAERLIKQGADVDVAGYRYGTPLMAAVRMGRKKAVDVLIKNKADVNLYSAGADLFAPLHTSVKYSFPKIAEILIKAGADVNLMGSVGIPPIFYAQTRELVEMLIKAGADLSIIDSRGMDAVESGKKCHWKSEVIEALTKEKAKIEKLKFGDELGRGLAVPQAPNKPTIRG